MSVRAIHTRIALAQPPFVGMALASDTPSTAESPAGSRDSLYIATYSFRNDCVKVGRSMDPERRCRDLGEGHAFTVSPARVFPGYGFLEQEVHRRLRAFGNGDGRGVEWFNVSIERAVEAVVASAILPPVPRSSASKPKNFRARAKAEGVSPRTVGAPSGSDAQRKHRAKVRLLVYQPRSRGARGDQVLAGAKRAREAARRRLRRQGASATDGDREAFRAADERVAAEIVESKCRRAQARVEFAVERSHFPNITKRFAEAHPEAAAKIRELSRLHRLVRKRSSRRCHDRERQDQLRERREALLREAWAVDQAARAATTDRMRSQ
jgi:hypothetical protein